AVAEGPAPARLMCALTLPIAAAYSVGRFLIPLFPRMLASLSETGAPVLLAGGMFAALLALASRDPRNVITAATICLESIALAGMISGHSSGVSGGMLLCIATGASAGLALYLLALFEQRHLDGSTIETTQAPQWQIAFLLVLLAGPAALAAF